MTSAATAGRDDQLRSPAPDQVTVLAQFIAKPDRESDVCETLLSLVGSSRADKGNVSYDLHRLKNNPAAFYLLANWADQAALDRHMAGADVRSLLNELAAAALVAPPMLSYARPLSRTDPNPNRPPPKANDPAQVTLVPFFTIKPDQVDEVGRIHLGMVGPTRVEPGCLSYDLYQCRDYPTVMFFYENWADQRTLDTHMNTPNFYRYVRGEVDNRLVVPWTAHLMSMISPPGAKA